MKDFFTLDDAVSGYVARGRSDPGIYGLVDAREPERVRYVGSTTYFPHRLYAHWHSTHPTAKTPKHKWVRDLKADGGSLALVVLERCDVGLRQSETRVAKEKEHIERLAELGMCDLNVALTPVGHPNSEDSYGKRMYDEIRRLRAENAELKARLFGDLV